MRKLNLVILTTLFSAAVMAADGASAPYLVCHGEAGSSATDLSLYPTNNGIYYRAEISAYPRFAHIPSPPPVTEKYDRVVAYGDSEFSNSDDSFVLRLGNPSQLRTADLNVEVSCSQQN